jgi:hypothetical protein
VLRIIYQVSNSWRKDKKMSKNVVSYIFKIKDHISGTLLKIDSSVSKYNANVIKAGAASRRLPLNIADLRGELAALEQKRSFAKTTTHVRHLNGVIKTTEKNLRKLENLPPKGFMGRMRELPKLLTGISLKDIGIAYASRELIRFAKGSAQLYEVQEKANAALRSSLESTGYAAGKTYDELKKQASGLQKVSLFGDEEINQAQAMLLTFKNVGGEVFDRTMPAILDLSTKMGTDLKSTVIQVGKALNDPKTGLTMMSRSGITFSEQQKQAIYDLVDAGKQQEAQMLILNELYSQFGGSAKAAAEAGLGPAQQMAMAWSDLREKIGGIVVDLVNKIVPPLKRMFEFLDANFDKVVKTIKIAAIAFISLKTSIFLTSKVMTLFARRAAIARLMSIRLSGGIKGLTRSIRVMNLATKANVIGALVGVVITAITYFTMFRKKTDEVSKAFDNARKVGQQYYTNEKMGLDAIFQKLRQTNPKSEERNKLVKQLKEMYPDINQQMLDEITNTNNLSTAYDTLIAKITQKARVKAQESVLEDLYQQTSTVDTDVANIAFDIADKKIKELEESYKKLGSIEVFDAEKGNMVTEHIGADFQLPASERNRIASEVMADIEKSLYESGSYMDHGVAYYIDTPGAYKKAKDEQKRVMQALANMQFSDGGASYEINTDGTPTGGTPDPPDPDKQLNTITGGGRQVKNITFNIGSLVGENTNNFKPGDDPADADDFMRKLTDALQLVLNDVNYAN